MVELRRFDDRVLGVSEVMHIDPVWLVSLRRVKVGSESEFSQELNFARRLMCLLDESMFISEGVVRLV